MVGGTLRGRLEVRRRLTRCASSGGLGLQGFATSGASSSERAPPSGSHRARGAGEADASGRGRLLRVAVGNQLTSIHADRNEVSVSPSFGITGTCIVVHRRAKVVAVAFNQGSYCQLPAQIGAKSVPSQLSNSCELSSSRSC